MASNIKFKRSAVQNRVPTTAQLDLGELALNTYDGKLYTEINTGSAAVIEIGSKLSSLVVDGANGGGGGDVVFHGTTAGYDLTWDYSDNSLKFADNVKVKIGAGDDLQLYHNGSHSFIQNYTGEFRILGNQLRLKNKDNDETYISCDDNGAVELYHNNLIRVTTTVDGADISGTGSLKIPVGTTAQRSGSPTAGDLRYNSTTSSFEGYSSDWGDIGAGGIGVGSDASNPRTGIIQNRVGVGFTDLNIVGAGISVTGYGTTVFVDFNEFKPGSFHRTIHNYTATAGQTTFAGLNYAISEKQIAVYLNGARLSEATYTATSGTTVVLDVGASVGDEVEIVNIHTNSDVDRKVNTYTATAGQTTFTGLSYNSKQELDVYLNGIRLASADYTATSGSTVVLAVGASVNDIVDIVSTGDGVSFRSTTDASGDRFTLNNLGIGTDQTPDALNVRGNANIVGVLTATSFVGTLPISADANNRVLTATGSGGLQAEPNLTFDSTNLYLGTDNGKIRIGLHGDLELYHNGSHSYIDDTGTGNLKLRSNNFRVSNLDESKLSATFQAAGAAELYHDNTKRFETTSTGASVTGNLAVSGVLTYDDVTNVDSVGIVTARAGLRVTADGNQSTNYISVGASDDLRIYHDGNNSFIENVGTGNLNLYGDDVNILNKARSEFMAKFIDDGAVELYHNASKKLETTANGVDVTGNATYAQQKFKTSDGTNRGGIYADNTNSVYLLDGQDHKFIQGVKDSKLSFFHDNVEICRTYTSGFEVIGALYASSVDLNDNQKILLGTGDDLEIYHDSSNNDSFIKELGSGRLQIWTNSLHLKNQAGDEVCFVTNENGNCELWFDNSKKLETTSAGVSVTGGITATSHITLPDDVRLKVGTGEDLHIYHNQSNSVIREEGTGNLNIQTTGGNVEILTNTTETSAKFISNGAVELYHDNNKKLETYNQGISLTGNCKFGDGSKSMYGNGSDMEIYHIADTTNVIRGSGALTIQSDTNVNMATYSGGETMGKFIKNGAVELYYDNFKCFNTNANGITLTAPEGGDCVIDMNADEGDDNPDKWRLNISQGGSFQLKNYADGSWENHIQTTVNSAVELYHNGTKKFETTSSGIDVTGRVTTDELSVVKASGNLSANFEAQNGLGTLEIGGSTGAFIDLKTPFSDDFDLRIDSSGTLTSKAGMQLNVNGSESGVNVISNGAVELYHNGNRQVFTIDGGMNWQDNKNAEFGNSGDLKIYHTGSENHIKGTGNHTLIFSTNNGERWGIQGDGHFKPHANDAYDLGTSSYRIRNIYTQDLQLSNEARKDKGGNDVDGTWGDWTLQEGEEEIFMINNRTGKKYAMMLKEVA